MKWRSVIVIFSIALAIYSPLAVGGAEGSNYLWRGEYEEAYAQTNTGIDSLSRPDTVDPFIRGVKCYRSHLYYQALKYLELECSNEILEMYRRYYLALTLQADSCTVQAIRIEADLAGRAEKEGFGFKLNDIYEAVEEAASAALAARSVDPDSIVAFIGNERLPGGLDIVLSRGYLDKGMVTKAKERLLDAVESRADTSVSSDFDEVSKRLLIRRGMFSRKELFSIADYALSIGDLDVVGRILELLPKYGPDRYQTRLLKGRYLAHRGKKREAARLFHSLFKSKASVALKRRALLLEASTLYSIASYKDAADAYSIYGRFYPRDESSGFALDTSARTYLALGFTDRAHRSFQEIRKRYPATRLATEAALTEAAIYRLNGKRARAYEVLESALKGAKDQLKPAVLYWMIQNCSRSKRRASLTEELICDFPGTIYAAAVTGRMPRLARRYSEPIDKIDLSLIEAAEKRAFDNLDCRINGVLSEEGKCYMEAFDRLVYGGLYDEADELGMYMIDKFNGDDSVVWELYNLGRNNGMVHLALKALDALSCPRGTPTELWYPAPYIDYVERFSRRWHISSALVLSVMREESAFDRNALSRVGACGLMQLMPSTARWIVPKLRHEGARSTDLFDSSLNIEAGTWYLSRLIRISNGSYLAAVAGYNAGSSRMKRWRRRFRPETNPLLSLELIGPRETRSFARRVLNSFVVYSDLGTPDMIGDR